MYSSIRGVCLAPSQDMLESQLDDACRSYLSRHTEVESSGALNPLRPAAESAVKLLLPAIVRRYLEDFGGSEFAAARWVAQYIPQKTTVMHALSNGTCRVAFREDAAFVLNKVARPRPPQQASQASQIVRRLLRRPRPSSAALNADALALQTGSLDLGRS